MNKETISPLKVLFIRLGEGSEGGEYAQDCIEQSQTLKLGFLEYSHELCQKKDWDGIRLQILQQGKTEATATKYIEEMKCFYTEEANTLWVTKYKDKLWWCFANPEIRLLEDHTKIRGVIGKWSDKDIDGNILEFTTIPSSIQNIFSERRTIKYTLNEDIQKYIVKLINGKLNPNYWWVNQGQSFEDEFNGGYIRSPQKEKDGGINQCFENMREIKRGDKVASCINGEIKAIGIVKFDVFEESIRAEDIGTEREKGWKAFVDWTLLESPFKIKKNHELIRLEEPPLDKNHNGRQGYIFGISSKLFHIICKSDLEIQEKLIEKDIINNPLLAITEKEQLIKARRGQGKFRENLEQIEKFCRLTKLNRTEFLIASHIKPWRDSTNEERLDGNNGLLLSPHIDKLFDKGWISFSDEGNLLYSAKAEEALEKWNIHKDMNVGEFTQKQCIYLKYHRENLFSNANLLSSTN
jgi:hypothetical protein